MLNGRQITLSNNPSVIKKSVYPFFYFIELVNEKKVIQKDSISSKSFNAITLAYFYKFEAHFDFSLLHVIELVFVVFSLVFAKRSFAFKFLSLIRNLKYFL